MRKIVTIFLFVLKHLTSTKIWILNTHSKSEYVSITPWKLILLYWLDFY